MNVVIGNLDGTIEKIRDQIRGVVSEHAQPLAEKIFELERSLKESESAHQQFKLGIAEFIAKASTSGIDLSGLATQTTTPMTTTALTALVVMTSHDEATERRYLLSRGWIQATGSSGLTRGHGSGVMAHREALRIQLEDDAKPFKYLLAQIGGK